MAVLLRRTFFFLILSMLALLAAVFAANNAEPIAVDVGFARLEDVSAAVAFTGAFAAGWLFGMLCAGAALVRSRAERRRLRRDLRRARAERDSLRAVPSDDAD